MTGVPPTTELDDNTTLASASHRRGGRRRRVGASGRDDAGEKRRAGGAVSDEAKRVGIHDSDRFVKDSSGMRQDLDEARDRIVKFLRQAAGAPIARPERQL